MSDDARRRRLRERFLQVDSSNVADALDELGLPDQGLAASFTRLAGPERLAGFAYTISGQMQSYTGTGDPQKMKACQGISPGEVSVWAGEGAGVCYFGELIAIGMRERGCVGALVDGGARDLRWLSEMQFPVFGQYRTPIQSIGRWKVTAAQAVVHLPGATSRSVRVAPGDFVLADDDGALVIPAHVIEPVLERAEGLTEKERRVREELKQGLTLAAALEKFGHV